MNLVMIGCVALQFATNGVPGSRQDDTGIVEVTYPVTDFIAGFSVSGPGVLDNGHLTADFRAGDRVGLHHSLGLLGEPESITLTINGGSPGNWIVLHLGSHFQTFTRVVGTLTGGSDEFIVPAPPEGWEHHGGQNDGVVRRPLRLTYVGIERGEGQADPTAVDSMTLLCRTKISKEHAIVADATLRVLEETETQRRFIVRVHTRALLPSLTNGLAAVELRDWQQHVLHVESKPIEFGPNAASRYLEFTVAAPRLLPFVEARVVVTAPHQADAVDLTTYTALPENPGDPELRPESAWGMGVYLYRYPNNPDGHRIMDEAASLAQRAGVKWSREEFSWAATEPRPGEFDFSFYDVVVDTAHRHGISVYGLLSYWSSWTEPYTEKGIDDFCRWARAVVRRYKDRIKHWEVYNEPNIFFWSGPKELYPVLLERCYQAIKEEDPEALVLGISTSGIDTKFIQQCLDAKASLDILTIHPYRSKLEEAPFIHQLQEAASLVGNRPVWITEMGWSTHDGGISEREQATLLARSYLTAIYSGACSNVSWYDFRNDGNDRLFNEHNFGVLHTDLRPKPAYRALTTACTTLAKGTPTPRTDFGDHVFALQMDDAVALWASEDADVAWRVVDGSPLVVNLMGEVLQPNRADEVSTLRLLENAPVFIVGGEIEGAPASKK